MVKPSDCEDNMKKYHDPEYDRVVDESVPKKQYEWFAQQPWFHKSYDEFLADNFTEITEGQQ